MTILKVNITEFVDMVYLDEVWRQVSDREPVNSKYWIVLPQKLRGLPVTDMELLGVTYTTKDYPWYAVLVQSQHIVFCQYSYLQLIISQVDDQDF